MLLSIVPSLAYRREILGLLNALVKTALWFGVPVDIAYCSGCLQMLCQQFIILYAELLLSFIQIHNFPNMLIFSYHFNKDSSPEYTHIILETRSGKDLLGHQVYPSASA